MLGWTKLSMQVQNVLSLLLSVRLHVNPCCVFLDLQSQSRFMTLGVKESSISDRRGGVSVCLPVGFGVVFWLFLTLILSGVMWEGRADNSVIMLSPRHINGVCLVILSNSILVLS